MAGHFRTFGNIYAASIHGATVYAISDPAHVRHVLVDNFQNYVRGQEAKRIALLMGNGIVASDGDFWKRQRRMIQPAFHRSVLSTLADLITSINAELLDEWRRAAEGGETINITRDLSEMTLEVTLRAIFGDDYAQVALAFSFLATEKARTFEFATEFRSASQVVLQIADKRRRQGAQGTDIFGMLMTATDRESGQSMSDQQLVNEIRTLIIAGHETTASTLNWMWYLISQHPEVEQKLAAELNAAHVNNSGPTHDVLAECIYSQKIIEETMRLYPALWLITRKAVGDDRLDDYFVPAGTQIYVAPYFVQRNPEQWREPERFDPDRFSDDLREERRQLRHIPFGAGPRTCIGEYLARLEMQIHIFMIAKQLRFQYSSHEPVEMDAGVNLRSKNDFIMTVQLNAGTTAPSSVPKTTIPQ
jgi:cytochrome P450